MVGEDALGLQQTLLFAQIGKRRFVGFAQKKLRRENLQPALRLQRTHDAQRILIMKNLLQLIASGECR